MNRILLAAIGAATALAAAVPAHAALNTGDIAFVSFNADEDGLSFVSFVDITANTTIYFSDNEWTGSSFNTGESYNQWSSGSGTIAAGTVVRLKDYDKTSLSASVGTLSRVTVSGNSNWGLSNSNETVYAYLGTSATAPTTFLTAITNGDFAVDGPLTGTGLTEGVNAIRLNANATSATPDYAEYTGTRTGQTVAGYKSLVANPSNWNVDTTNGDYATTVPNTTAFEISAVPEGDGLVLAMTGLLGLTAAARRKKHPR